MKIAGIVAEYNPFHKGHAYQIQKIRELLGKDAGVVCVMSGDFVQRGEPAMFSKYARAEAAVRCGAAAPAVAVKDTVKVIKDGGSVEKTLDRSALRAVQTPQVFEASLLRAALQSALEDNAPVTDDCSAVERLGKVVFLIDGDEENLKITTPMDLVVAQAILQARETGR